MSRRGMRRRPARPGRNKACLVAAKHFDLKKREAAHSAARPGVAENRVFSVKRQAVWFEMQSVSN